MLRELALTILLASAVAVLLTDSAGATGNPKFLVATGEEVTTNIVPGTTTCIGGQELAPMVCSPGTKQVHLRDFVLESSLINVAGTGAGYLSGGTDRVAVNCNLDGNYQGHCWGTFQITVPGKGQWEGSWTGTFDFVAGIEDFQAVGHGRGGELDGLQMKFDEISSGGPLTFTARINTK